MSNTKNFSEISVGEIFILRTFCDGRNNLFIKIVRPNGKYAALLYDDFKSLSEYPSGLISGNFEIYTDCKCWACEPIKPLDIPKMAKKETAPEDEEVEMLTLYNTGLEDVTTLKVTKKQKEAIEYLFHAGLLVADKIIDKSEEIIDLT